MKKYVIKVYKKQNNEFIGYLEIYKSYRTITSHTWYCAKYKTWICAKLECMHMPHINHMYKYKAAYE